MNDHLELLKWAKSNGCPLDEGSDKESDEESDEESY